MTHGISHQCFTCWGPGCLIDRKPHRACKKPHPERSCRSRARRAVWQFCGPAKLCIRERIDVTFGSELPPNELNPMNPIQICLRPIFPQPLSPTGVVVWRRGRLERLPHPRRVGTPLKLLGETTHCRNISSAAYFYWYPLVVPSIAHETIWHALCLLHLPSLRVARPRACQRPLLTRTPTKRQARHPTLRRRRLPPRNRSISPAGASTMFERCLGRPQRRKTTRQEKPGVTEMADARLTSNSIPTSRPTSMEPLITR
jgi:hypothetical protein